MYRRISKVFDKKTSKKLNNKGISLVELIVVVAILGIVITPLLHAFITSATINSKARDKLNETVFAENLMEEFNDASIEDMILKYSGEIVDGEVQFLNLQEKISSQEIDADVFVDVYLSPDNYEEENAVNLVDLEVITAADCAIYSMPIGYDDEIYKIFEDNSASAEATNSTIYTAQNQVFFEKNLDRTIYISLIKTGTSTEGTPLVRVEMNMVYEFKGTESCLEPENLRYTTKTKELFDNSITEIEFKSVYLMFVPRYLAAEGGAHLDNIKIFNYSNVSAKAFVVRQATTEDATAAFENYKINKSAYITVIENNTQVPYTESTISSLQVRTNMHEPIPGTYTNPIELNCKVSYRNQRGTAIVSDDIAKSILNISTLDGRTLDNTATRNRIYEMRVEIYKEETISGISQKTILSTMIGTKIE